MLRIEVYGMKTLEIERCFYRTSRTITHISFYIKCQNNKEMVQLCRKLQVAQKEESIISIEYTQEEKDCIIKWKFTRYIYISTFSNTTAPGQYEVQIKLIY